MHIFHFLDKIIKKDYKFKPKPNTDCIFFVEYDIMEEMYVQFSQYGGSRHGF